MNEASKSDVVEWVFPPEQCTIDPVSAGENVHTTGTGIPKYWIHQKHEQVDGGSDLDTFDIGEDGKWRSLNYIPRLNKGDKITVQQSKTEFDDDSKWSKPYTITVT